MLSDYNPKEIEKKWQKRWEDLGIYRFDPESDLPVFSIDTPPPTVSGDMHLGHAFSYSQMDFIARYKRMQGYNLFYPFGTDDNGLPTERLVENLNNVTAKEMKRSEFVKLCLETLERVRPDFVGGWKRIGLSADFGLYYSTINSHSRRISQRSFIELYEMGREYRKETPFIWCPTCQTAISQVEMEDRELLSSFNDIIFKLDGQEDLVIATTRPEMLPACVAIFAHPDDERYNMLFGKKAEVPLFGHEVPIIPDEKADPTKGTGIVMCCTFGDTTDIEWYLEHNLPLKIAITKDGRMTGLCGKYEGMTIKDARKKITEDLKDAGLLVKSEEIVHHVNVHERCGTEIEILNTKQWFIRYLDMKDEFIRAGREIKWYPEHMRSRFENWVDGLKWDWCISRQRYFGVPFPVWYCKKCGEVKLAEKDSLPVDPLTDHPGSPCRCGSSEFEPEKDVLDTWATSSLTPDLAIELVRDESVKKKLYPMSLRPQAHDIITFWLFNTVVKGLLHKGKIPWENTMISGWALDPMGKKMSKSKGNVIEPGYILDKYSADALRFWAAGSKLGEDLPYQEKDMVTGKKFLIKMWNASKFALMHLEGYDGEEVEPIFIDRWILSKLNRQIEECTAAFEQFEYSRIKALMMQFFLHDFCDNYLEMIKCRLYPDRDGSGEDFGGGPGRGLGSGLDGGLDGGFGQRERESARFTLYYVLVNSIKLLAPIIPHITEEIYQKLVQVAAKGAERGRAKGEKSIHTAPWPVVDRKLIDERLEESGDRVVEIIAGIRRYKSSKGISLNSRLGRVSIHCNGELLDALEKARETVRGTLRIEELRIEKGRVRAEEHVMEIVPNFSTIGPEFKTAAKKIVQLFESRKDEVYRGIRDNGFAELAVNGTTYKILPDHIKEVKKEFVSLEGERIDIIDMPEIGATVVVARM